MLIEVTVDYLPHFGVRGTRKELPEVQARALILLNKVCEVEDPSARATRRVYQRRDLTAEGEPTAKAEPEPFVAPPPPPKKRGRPRKPASSE